MSEVDLAAAARALRTLRTGTTEDAQKSENAIVERLQRRRPRSARARWLLPAAAMVVVSSGWAAADPSFRGGLVALLATSTPAVTRLEQRQRPPAPSSVGGAAVGSAQAPAAPLAVSTSHSASGPAAARQAPPRQDALGVPSAAPPLPSVAVKPSASPASPLGLYRRAHALQFGAGDCAAAMVAWDEYLALAPGDALALEARFNRGACLHALGRRGEARAALAPFAAGSYGSYRQEEAQKLLSDDAR